MMMNPQVLQEKCRVFKCFVCFFIILCAGCSGTQATTQVVKQTDEKPEVSSVSLYEIKTPMFKEDFATLTLGDFNYCVQWGVGESCVCWRESGYPGFGYPIVIEINTGKVAVETAFIVTSWGQYEYRFINSDNCYAEYSNLVRLCNGSTLVKWGQCTEYLYIFNSDTGECATYVLERGTQIEV